MKVEIRRPTKESQLAIEELFEKTLIDNFKLEDIKDPTGELMKSELNKLKDELQLDFDSNGLEAYHLMAMLDDSIAGIIAYGKPSTIISTNIPIYDDRLKEIKSAYIHPDYQAHGIGSLLLDAISVELTNLGSDQFCLDCGYKKSQGFWIRHLGNPIKTLPDFWGQNQHHMIWVSDL